MPSKHHQIRTSPHSGLTTAAAHLREQTEGNIGVYEHPAETDWEAPLRQSAGFPK